MDEAVSFWERKINWGKSKIVTEKLDGTPSVEDDNSEGLANIVFGNTGFKIIRSWKSFDFLPEGKVDFEQENAAKYATMLAVSLLNVYELLNNPEKRSALKIREGDLKEISALTNEKLINAITGLFSRSKVPGIAHMNEEGYRIVINLSKFKTLEEKDPLIVYLKKVAIRAKDTNVSYSKKEKEENNSTG